MKYEFVIFLLLLFIFSSCNPKEQTRYSKKEKVDIDPYPNAAYVCFDKHPDGSRKFEFKLGDSCKSYAQYFNLNCEDLKSSYSFGETHETRGDFGTTFSTISFELDKKRRLNSFNAEWTHKSSSNPKVREEFYHVVQRHALQCLWEESLNIYKNRDTLRVNRGGCIYEFISDFNDKKWVITYNCKLN